MRSAPAQWALALAFVMLWGFASAIANAQANNLIDLGVATAHALNNNGQVALDQGIYASGTITALPAVSGGSTPASALAINASGQVAGTAISPAITGSDPIAYLNGTLIDIGSLILTGVLANQGGGKATGINSGGIVAGWYVQNGIDDTLISFTYNHGTVTNLPAFPCTTFNASCGLINGPQASGINDSGEIVGSVAYAVGLSSTNSCQFSIDAFSYNNGSWSDFGPGTAYAVNASGQVTGTLTLLINSPGQDLCQTTGTSAFLNTSGTTTNLGTLPGGQNSVAYALNATGQVDGSSDFTGSAATHAFFYNGVMTDLNAIVSKSDPLSPYVTLASAVGINDSRLIVANGTDSRTGLAHAYLIQGPWINVTPAALSFGNEAVGGTSPPQDILVTNAGTTAIPLGSVSTSNNFPVQADSCTASLAPGAQCTISVAFAPTVAGALTGSATVPSGGTDYVVALSGGAPLTATLSASSSTATVGLPLKLTWVSSPGSVCSAMASSGNSSFSGSIPSSGSKILTEKTAATVVYSINCTAPGAATATPTTSVVWAWPPVTVALTAAPTTITAGQATTLTWNSSNATTCAATGGGSGDNWAGTKATSGSQAVTEPFATATPSVTLTFGITCRSTASGLSGQATANVTDDSPPASKSGGGAIDLTSIFALLGIWALRRRAAQG